jgi:hypothetical protein
LWCYIKMRRCEKCARVNLPYDFGKKSEANILVGGVGSGSWYRLNKKSTTNECQSIDVRYLHRNGLLKPGHYFSLRWSRAGRQTGSIGGVAYRDQVTLLYRHRRGPGGEWDDIKETVPLDWTACNSGGERPWFICPGERAAAGGLQSCTDRGATSCAATATTLPIRASGITRCTALCTVHRTSAGALEEART